MPVTVIDSGTYTFEVDSGFDYGSFRLDDATKGVLDNTQYTLGPNISYVDLTQYCKQITYKRGRQRTADQFGAGTMQVVVDSQLAGNILNPLDDGSPYYNTQDDYFGLEPGRRVRLSRDGQFLFIGTIVQYDYKYALSNQDIVTIQCADDFYKLSQARLDEWNVAAFPAESGLRIDAMLDQPEVDLFDGVERDIATGTVELGHSAAFTVPAGTVALAYANQINQTAEGGRLFMTRSGVFKFEERIGNTLSAPVASFSNDGIETPYNDLTIEFDGSDVVNRVTVTTLGNDTYTATDATSIATYFNKALNIDNSLLSTAAETQAYAEYLLEPWPISQFTSIQTYFPSCTETQRDDVAVIDIGDTIQITASVPNPGDITQELAVEGIQATIDFRRGQTIRFFTSPTTIVYQLVLDDPMYGIIDSTNVLG